jgi:hypothetical protein
LKVNAPQNALVARVPLDSTSEDGQVAPDFSGAPEDQIPIEDDHASDHDALQRQASTHHADRSLKYAPGRDPSIATQSECFGVIEHPKGGGPLIGAALLVHEEGLSGE